MTRGVMDPIEFEQRLQRRFCAQYEERPTGCWEWTGRRNRKGYGVLWVRDRQVYAHRFVYDRFVAEIAPGLMVLHHCDNPPCINPEHLYAGTAADNMRDRAARHPLEWVKGSRNPAARLTDTDVDAIRVLLDQGVPKRQIGSRFGVSATTVLNIAKGRRKKDSER